MRKIVNYLKNHVIDSTAVVIESTPIFSAFEVGMAGMSDDVSINARLIGAAITYGGICSVLTKGRDAWRKLFKVSDTTKERIQMFHDTAYLAAFNLVAAPTIYYASGSRALKEIAIGTACSIAFGSINGTPLGYAIDTFRDLTGIKECERSSYPKLLKRQDTRTKKSLAALLTAGTIVLTAGIYSLTPNCQDTQPTTQEVKTVSPIEEMVND